MKKTLTTRKQISKQLDKKAFRDFASILGTKGEVLKSLLEERRRDREREEAKIRKFKLGRKRPT